jgi:hypothetical protein
MAKRKKNRKSPGKFTTKAAHRGQQVRVTSRVSRPTSRAETDETDVERREWTRLVPFDIEKFSE